MITNKSKIEKTMKKMEKFINFRQLFKSYEHKFNMNKVNQLS